MCRSIFIQFALILVLTQIVNSGGNGKGKGKNIVEEVNDDNDFVENIKHLYPGNIKKYCLIVNYSLFLKKGFENNLFKQKG